MVSLCRKIWHACKKSYQCIVNPVVGDIVMLHRVTLPDFVLEQNRALEITPQDLVDVILSYRNAGYVFVSLDEFIWHKQHDIIPKNRYVTFTFDDGYADNYRNVYPILKDYGIPFTIYVSTSFLQHKIFLWWYILELELRERSEFQIGNVTYLLDTLEAQNTVFRMVHAELSQMETADCIDWFREHNIEWQQRNKDLNMRLGIKEAELKQMAEDCLCTIGSHTISHARLTKLSETALMEELYGSKKTLERIINKEISHFSYPYGDTNSFVARQVALCGYKTAVSVVNHSIVRKQNVYQLDRVKVGRN